MKLKRFLYAGALCYAQLVGCDQPAQQADSQQQPRDQMTANTPDRDPILLSSESEARLFKLSDILAGRLFEDGPSSLSPEELVFALVWELDSVMAMDGLSHFYFYSSADYAKETVTALEAIGASQAAEVLRQSNAVFGPGGPPHDGGKRQQAISDFTDEQSALIAEGDRAYSVGDENILVLLDQYVLDHPDAFRSYLD